MKVDIEQALVKYENELRIGARVIYRQEAERFLSFVDGELDKDSVIAYLNWLADEGYANGTIVKISIPVMRKLLRENGVPWPLRPGEGPKIKEGDVYAPALDPALVERLIAIARTPRTDRLDRALLALATTYGMRRVELAGISKREIDLKSKVLLVRTAKGGRERWHTIPEEIIDVLKIRWEGNSPTRVSAAYLSLEKLAGISRMREVGWHSIRRILVRQLVEANLPAYMIDNFLRWKRSGSDMQRVYYGSTVVGEGQTRQELGKIDRETDEKVFSVHPFLKYWR